MEFPKKVIIRYSFYGCDTGCDGYEVIDPETEERLDWSFEYDLKEDEAREEFNIPNEVEIEFEGKSW